MKYNNFEICAVIVCYYPNELDLLNSVNSLLTQVKRIIIVDNTDDMSQLNLKQKFERNESIEYIQLGENSGIGAAQNIGLKIAFENSFKGVLIMDQDSVPPGNLVEELIKGILFLKEKGHKLACIGPTIYNRDTGSTYKPRLNKGLILSDFIEKDAIISSGSIILKDAYESIGGMEESLFIDSVDFEWCWRAQKQGYKSYISKNISMAHRVGLRDFTLLRIFKLQVPSPIRHYYQFRNTIILFPRSYVPMYWKFRSLIIKSVEFVVFPILIDQKYKRIKYMLKGLLHGLLRKKGGI